MEGLSWHYAFGGLCIIRSALRKVFYLVNKVTTGFLYRDGH